MAKRLSDRLERRHIETIVTVFRCGSIHGAARELGLPQPLVTNLLRDTERILGKPLFARSHKGCVVLPDAKSALDGAIYAFKALETLDAIDESPNTTLRLGCIPRVTHGLVPALMRELKKVSPAFRVDVVEGTAQSLNAQLIDGELDCIIGRRPAASVRDSFIIENLYEEKTVVIAGKNHPLAAKSRIGLKDLIRYPWILPKTSSYSRDIWSELFSRVGVAPPHPMIESLSFLSNLHLVSKSDCVSIAPDRVAWEFEDLGLIAILNTQANFGEYMIAMTYHSTVVDHPGFKNFMIAAKRAAAAIQSRENVRVDRAVPEESNHE
jgi:DNA-binding transcriptional LysR family regulator